MSKSMGRLYLGVARVIVALYYKAPAQSHTPSVDSRAAWFFAGGKPNLTVHSGPSHADWTYYIKQCIAKCVGYNWVCSV